MKYKREFMGELTGTFLLVPLIFTLTEGCNVGRPDDALAPVFIGLTVASVIGLMAPWTQAGINPARDLGPRIVAWLAGWKEADFPDNRGGFFFIYILAPILGGSIASIFSLEFLNLLGWRKMKSVIVSMKIIKTIQHKAGRRLL